MNTLAMAYFISGCLSQTIHTRDAHTHRRHYAHKETRSINPECVIAHSARKQARVSVKKSGQG